MATEQIQLLATRTPFLMESRGHVQLESGNPLQRHEHVYMQRYSITLHLAFVYNYIHH